MSTKNRTPAPFWTEAKRDAAVAGRYYIKVGGKRGNLLLSGAAKKWETDPKFTYISDLRIAGSPADLEKGLVSLGKSKTEARAAVATGYTAGSVADKFKARYETELSELKGGGKKKVTKKNTASVNNGRTIAEYAAMVDAATIVNGRLKSPRRKRERSTSPKRRRKSTPKGKSDVASRFRDRVSKVSAGKVLDVSKLHVDGSGAVTVDVKKLGPKSKKFIATGYRIASDNKRGINAAAKLLGDDGVVAAWVSVSGHKAAPPKRSKSKSPKRKRSKSPKRKSPRKSPAKALPMSPVSSPSLPALPTGPSVPVSPRGLRVPTIGSPRGSPRL